MTKKQKIIIIITVALVFLSFVFPHWRSEYDEWASFYPIFFPLNGITIIDFQKTCAQAVAILVLGIIGALLIEKVSRVINNLGQIKKRNAVVLLGLLLILLSYLFPCWEYKRDGNVIQSKQFHFIYNPPHYERSGLYDFTENKQQMIINYKQLQYQIAIIVLITLGLIYMVREK